MSNKNKDRMSSGASVQQFQMEVGASTTTEEAPNFDATDDFDPFGVVECVDEHVDIALDAPPEACWYHGRLDRTVAEDRLRQANQLGSYLIRESDRKPGAYVLSFLGKTGINHFRITAMCGDYYIGGREFDSLSDLIGYYTTWSDLLKGERLQFPVAPPEPVYDKKKVKSILTYNQMPETDELSFGPGDIFVVHNDMGDGWLWVTSQSTGLSGIINRELVQELNGNVDPVETCDWFHANITKEDAANYLARAGPGSWLVRPSDSTEGDYSIFFYCNRQIQRFKIQKTGRQYFMGGRYFDSIKEIIERYSKEQIVEGYILGSPVLKPSASQFSDSNSQGLAGRDIYATMRQSSGSNFFLNRKDNIVIKGFLNKKSQRTKKWKYMYFVLNGTEQQLYYFDNQKRSKPKGLIDLSFCSIYPVHDSLFGRPNVFQLILRALNQVSAYYICADDSDQAQEWIQALKPFCTNTQPKKTAKASTYPTVTELRSLQLKIFNSQKLSSKHVPHPYCIVSLNEVKVCRTQVKEAPEACWDDEFMLDDIPPDIESFVISIYNKEKMSKDKEILNMKISLSELEPGKHYDEWHNLSPVTTITKSSDKGTLRVSVRYLHEIIMPVKEYSGLKELLLAKDLETVLALSNVCLTTQDRIPLATALLQVYRHERQEAHLLRMLTDHDIENEECKENLFRSNTLATTLMDQYMKMTSTNFLHTAVQGAINKILESKVSCDVMVESPSDLETNSKHLINFLTDVVNAIIAALETFPVVLRYIFGCLQRKAKLKWPNDTLVRTRVVSGFIFLRLLCLAILNPRQFNLITEAPSQTGARNLKLIASSLMKLASLSEAREFHMELINPFIQENKPKIVAFIDELSNVTEVPTSPEASSIALSRSLATIHQICIAHLDDLQQLSNSKPFVKKLVTVTEMLTNHKKHYMAR